MAIENVEFEEIKSEALPSSEAVEAKVLTADDIAKNEIKKFNIADAAIAEMKKQYSGLTISGIDDKEGYKKVHAAWQIVRGKRLQVEKVHKIIKADYLVVSRAIDGEKNRLLDLISPLENSLNNELERIDGLIEAEKQKAEREAQERLQTRVATLLDNGMQFNGSFYAIGETISIDVVTLKNYKDAEFTALLERVKAENTKLIEAKAEAERQEREERERIQKQKEENERQEAELKRQREEMERQQAEMRKQRTDLRVQILQNAGFIWDSGPHALVFRTQDAGNLTVSLYDFTELTGDEWDAKFLEIRAGINRLRALQAEKDEERRQEEQRRVEAERQRKEKAARWNERAAQLYKLGMHERKGEFYIITESFGETNFIKAAENFDADAETWQSALKVIEEALAETRRQDEENKKAEAERKEAERVAALSDMERIDEYTEKLDAIRSPEITDSRVKTAFLLFQQTTAEAMNTMYKTIHLITKK